MLFRFVCAGFGRIGRSHAACTQPLCVRLLDRRKHAGTRSEERVLLDLQRRSLFGSSGLTKQKQQSDVAEEHATFNSGFISDAARRFVIREGHKFAHVNPLSQELEHATKLSTLLEEFKHHLSFTNPTLASGIVDSELGALLEPLTRLYCSKVGVEFSHIDADEERNWLVNEYERLMQEEFAPNEKLAFAKLMLESQSLDRFMASKYATVKRYGGEGCESMLIFFQKIFELAAVQYDVEDVIMCMPHRGRLNLLTCLLNYPPALLFRKMSGLAEFPDRVLESGPYYGDVLSHLSTATNLTFGPSGKASQANYSASANSDSAQADKKVHVCLIPNPSHLEAANPVVVGKARGRFQTRDPHRYPPPPEMRQVLCLQVHGDAAFPAQGIVAETFQMGRLPFYTVNGSMHLIVNNQIGFTTAPHKGRSTMYASCLAKSFGCPIVHVNADSIEDVARVAQLGMAYRARYGRDFLVDLICFRRWGHNEMDDPTLTQPVMYRAIAGRKSIPDLYAEQLNLTSSAAKESDSPVTRLLDEHADACMQKWKAENEKAKDFDFSNMSLDRLGGVWGAEGMQPPSNTHLTTWDTGVSIDILKWVGARSVMPTSRGAGEFNIHPNLRKTHVEPRLKRLQAGGNSIDWATAEALAVGTILAQNLACNVRLCGQDVGRGTFSHRHAMFFDYRTEEECVPINRLDLEKDNNLPPVFFGVCESPLSEEAVLGFEYGMSIEHPRRLCVWEAQFGDFFNGAQVIIDTYVAAGESKWLVQNSLVLILPHGYDGAGPEHSSCRLERWLQMTDSNEIGMADSDHVNMNVCAPTTPAQYFHLLRRQMVRNFRKPLIVVGPKTMLRLPQAQSSLQDMAEGTYFRDILDDPFHRADENAQKVDTVVLCAGKHYYFLQEHLEKLDKSLRERYTVIRIESLCPFPADLLRELLKGRYKSAKNFVWAQEEPRNQGAWSFIAPRLTNLVGFQPNQVHYAGRPTLPLPAAGISSIHKKQVEQLVKDTFRF